MPVKWEKLEKNKVKLEIEVPSPEVDTALARAYRQVVTKVNLPGFRKGKIPRRILEMRFGPEILHNDALDILIPAAYSRAIEEADLEPIDEPEIECHQLESGKPLLFEAVVQVVPEVALGAYKGIELDREEVEVTDEQVDRFLDNLREQQARLVTVEEGAAEKGDLLIIDFVGLIEGEPFEGGKAENYSLELGAGSFIEGFEEQLEGILIGEEREVNISYPDDYYREELAGKEVTFEVTVKEIKRKQLPELDDEFIKEMGEFETLEELKADARKRLEEMAKERSQSKLENDLIEKISEAAQVELPEVMVERRQDQLLNDFKQALRYQGLTLEKYVELSGKTVEEIRQEHKPEAEKRVKSSLVLEAIIKQEGIAVEDTEIDQKIEEIARSYNDQPDRVKELFEKQDRLRVLNDEIKLKKVIDFLLQEAKIKTLTGQSTEE